MFCFKAHRLPCGCLTEPLFKSRIHEVACDGCVLQGRSHLPHFPQPAQAHCGISQGSLESGESTKLWTSSTPQRGRVVPLPELLLKVPGRVTTGRHSHCDWGTSFPLIKLAFPLMCDLVTGLLGRKCRSLLLWGPFSTMFKM